MSDQQLDDEPIVMVPWVPPKNDAWKKILRPVTIFQVLQAESSPFFEDKSLVIEGRGFAAVTFVAHVISVEINPARASYTLEDGTGRIRAHKDLNSVTLQHGLSPEAEEEETTRCKALEHTYVEVVGTPRKENLNKPWLSIISIHPVHGYHQVMYHTLNVVHSNMLIQQYIQPYNSDEDIRSNEDMEINISVDASQAYQDDISMQHHTTNDMPASHPVLPNTFSPQKHQLYANLKPLERAIMKYLHHWHRNHCVLIAELAQVIQASYECTELQFNLAVQTLLSEAYITCPLDDGYVVITPRH